MMKPLTCIAFLGSILLGIALTGCRSEESPADAVLSLPVNLAGAEQQRLHDQQLHDQWSSFRGGSLNGVKTGVRVPIQWSRESNVRWKVPVSGDSNSSPVVWEDQIFLLTSQRGGSRATVELLSVDRKSGQKLWSKTLGKVHGETHSRNGFASATVATDGERVYSFVGSLGLICCNMQGDTIWQHVVDRSQHEWGSASSPVLFGNLVIQLCDSRHDSFIMALKKETGRVVWKTARSSCGGWTTPVLWQPKLESQTAHNQNKISTAAPNQKVVDEGIRIAQSGGAVELIVNGTGQADDSRGTITSYNPVDGSVNWKYDGTSEIPCPTMIAGDGVVVSTSGANGPMIALKPSSPGEPPRLMWKRPSGGPQVPTGLIVNKLLFTVSDSGAICCYDLESGKQHWCERLTGNFVSSLVASDEFVFATNQKGKTYVLRAQEKFDVVAANSFNDRCTATPALCDSEMLFRTEHFLFCVGESSAGVAQGSDLQLDTSRVDTSRVDTSRVDTSQVDFREAKSNQSFTSLLLDSNEDVGETANPSGE